MNPEDSKQFDDIMGRNFTEEDKGNMSALAGLGALADKGGYADKVAAHRGALPARIGEDNIHTYFKHFVHPDDIGVDGKGVHAAIHDGPIVHKWRGGSVIEHEDRETGTQVGFTPVFGREWDSDKPLTYDSMAVLGRKFRSENESGR